MGLEGRMCFVKRDSRKHPCQAVATIIQVSGFTVGCFWCTT